jgi:hypothetical protein
MIALAHMINPVIADQSSDLFIAQPITFETMRIAQALSKDSVGVRLYAIQHRGEERIPMSENFTRVPDLKRSIADIKRFRQKRNLPLIKDILDTFYECSHADYFIYTNVDIALQPYFYKTVAFIIKQGYDGFVINRRTIPNTYSSIHDIPLMYAEIGEPHKGYDCFIFRRELYAQFKLGIIHVGTAGIGRALLANMTAYSSKFREFRNEHLTFHIGDACPWKKDEFSDYFQENWNEYLTLYQQIEIEREGFEPTVRSYLLDTGDKRFVPDFEKCYIEKGRCLHLREFPQI